MASNQGLNSLATIIKRLEAATSRLEDIAEAQAAGKAPPSTASTATAAPPAPASVASAATNHAAPPPPAEDPPVIQAYDEQVKPLVEAFVKLSGELSPVLKEQAGLVEKLFADQRSLILQASVCKKPADSAFQSILAPLATGIQKVGDFKDANRSNRDFFNHLSAVAEGIPAIGWVTISPKPAPYVAEMKNATQFYSNRVIKDFKDKDAKHVEWTRSFGNLLEGLRKYVFEHHTTGLVWNPKGQDATKYTPPSALSSSAAPAGGPPPPPPPPPPAAPAPPPPPPAGAAPAPAASGGSAAVFAEINQGSEITSRLRHVPKDQMTHKNPELRASSVVPDKVGAGGHKAPGSPPLGKKPMRPAKPSALSGKKPSKMALEGNKWAVEFFENDKTLVIEETEISQSVNLFGCKNSTLQIRGKVNAVNLINCSKTSVLIQDVVSAIAITSSPSFTIQVTGKAPTIQLDSTDGGQIYLSAATAETVEITTAKCSAINVSIPEKNDEGEFEEGLFAERPVPEMIKLVVKDGKLVASIIEPSG